MTATMIAVERRPHDDRCERGTVRAEAHRCQCGMRFAQRSENLPEREVWWPWLHGTPRTPHEWSVARRCWEEVQP